ncbi:MAG: PAS domain-containing protein [Deltaproteobacteria bacterium]|nr:PAS domain-containing protein [Deltaproteobacteria bacterium]
MGVRLRIAAIGGESRDTIEQVVRGLAPDNGVGYVIIHTGVGGILAMLQQASVLPVVELAPGVRPQADHIYLAPAEREAVIERGVFALVDPSPQVRAPIDRMFRSLADELGREATGIILAGHGVDGTLGMKRLKEVGGLTICQAPTDAVYPAMPLAAIASGMVDLILPAAEIAARLAYGEPEQVVADSTDDRRKPDSQADTLRDILALVRIRSGHDFSQYKRATIDRRIGRRMQVCQTATIAEYHRYLREHPPELASLLRDLLISVTNFFRDVEAFEVLERLVIPKMFAGTARADQVRVWVAGCATGEEAYSIGMLLAEYASTLREPPQIQIFATDIDEDALAHARAGRYSEAISVDVSQDRLDRFFVHEGGSFRVKKELRELILFSPHNLLRDPPFSHLDLVCCRNVMIYLNRDAQDRLLGMFHFALRPDGCLFLGSSESAENPALQFTSLDPKGRVFLRRITTTTGTDLALPSGRWHPSLPASPPRPTERTLTSFGELHHRLVEQYAPPSVIINEELDLVHLSEHAGAFMMIAGGEPTRQLLRLVLPALRLDLRATIFAARTSRKLETHLVRFDDNGRTRVVELRVRPVELPDHGNATMLVVFDEREGLDGQPSVRSLGSPNGEDRLGDGGVDDHEPMVRELENDLRRTREQLRDTVEQYETSLEELKASNEELHAINEELRSATEELETSKEELQSVNEELITLNHELKGKVDEVSRGNSDLQNLMTSTDIAVLFLDRMLDIKRFTPSAQGLFNIIKSDVGRPLAHLTHRLETDDLPAMANQVLQHLQLVEREVRSHDGGHYLMRILPYRSVEDRIDGVVMTFVNVTELKHAEVAVAERDAMLRLAERAAVAGIWELDTATRRMQMSEECARLHGFPPVGRVELATWLHRIDERDRAIVGRIVERALDTRTEIDVEFRIAHPEAGTRWLWCLGRAEDTNGGTSIVGIALDVTERRRTEAALRESEERFRLALSAAPIVATSQNAELSYTWGYVLGRDLGAGVSLDAYFAPAHAARLAEIKREVVRTQVGRGLEVELVFSGQVRTFDLRIEPIVVGGGLVGITTVGFDITTGKLAENALRASDRRKDEFLATLSHELRNPLTPLRIALDVQKLAGNDPVQIERTRDIMDRQVTHLINLVDELLELSRITEGKIELRSERLDAVAVIKAAVEDTQAMFDSAGHVITVALPSEPMWLQGDEARLTQVFVNLLTNAAKYTPDGGTVTISSRRDAARGVLVVLVRDTGIGIDPEALQSVFEIFVQCRDANGRARGGLGIGLNLVRRLVELHGGRVMACSEGAGRGSEFAVELPLDT